MTDARGRVAKGNSGNPRGRPPGIPNPRRQVLDLATRPLSPEALPRPVERKPRLWRRLAARLLPPLRAAVDPAARLGIDPTGLRTFAYVQPALLAVSAFVARRVGAVRCAAHHPAGAGRVARVAPARPVAIPAGAGIRSGAGAPAGVG